MKHMRIDVAVLILFALLAQGASVVGAGSDVTRSRSAHTAVPPAAAMMAKRLGIVGSPVIGDQPAGYGGPWALWLTQARRRCPWASNQRQSCLIPTGQILSAGPDGAQGTFVYVNVAAQPSGGKDAYRGAPLSPTRALRIARTWLHTMGGPLLSLHPRVMVEKPGSTVLGGTGLCCFATMDIVSWGGGRDHYGFMTAPVNVYIADGGTVVQVAVTAPTHSRPVPRRCRDHRGSNATGVPLGRLCFDYPSTAGEQITIDVGGHEPWRTDPQQVARTFAYGLKLVASPDRAPLRVLLSTPEQARYAVSHQGRSYRLTLVPAFPGLAGSIWMLVDVARI